MSDHKKTKEYIEKLQSLKLSETSRVRMQDELQEYAHFHRVIEPVRVMAENRSMEQVSSLYRGRTSLFSIFNRPKKPMTAIMIALVLMVGGGTSFAAEGAVPGDVLYPIKTEVNETIKSAFALSSEAEANLQARLTKERLEEAETLAARGELTAYIAADLSTRVSEHYERAETQTAAAEANGNYDVSARVRADLEGGLRAYAATIAELNGTVAGNDAAILVTTIQNLAVTTATSQQRATTTIEMSADASVTAATTVREADQLVDQVIAALARTESELSAEGYARVKATVEQAVAAQAEAGASLDADAYAEAYTAAQTALRFASEAKTNLDSLLRLQIDFTTGRDTNGVLDLQLESDSSTEAAGSANYNNTRSNRSSATREEADDNSTSTEADAEVGVRFDTSVETNAGNAAVEAETSARTNLGF